MPCLQQFFKIATPVVNGRQPNLFFEEAGEGGLVCEPDLEGDVVDAQLVVDEQELGLLDAHLVDPVQGRVSAHFFHGDAQMVGSHLQGFGIEVEGSGQGVVFAQQAAAELCKEQWLSGQCHCRQL